MTGFKNVSRRTDCITKPFHAVVSHGGRDNHLGNFATAEEAALAVARFLGPEGVAAVLAASTPMTAAEAQAAAAEAHAAAAAEGLTLVPSAENATGFMGVVKDGGVQAVQSVLRTAGASTTWASSRRRRRRRSRSRASSGRRTSRTSSQSSHR